MKAITYQGPRRVELSEVERPRIEQPTDAIVRVTTASICGSDLHIYHGLISNVPGLILGHEFVGVVEEAGPAVDFRPGERVMVEAGLRCGQCDPCKRGQGCLYGGIFGTATPLGTLQGGQAEYVRVPFAQKIMHRIADDLTDEDVILLTDNFPTGYTAATWANIQPGDTVVVYGCGAVGLCAQISAQRYGAARVFAVDRVPERLAMAQRLGSIPLDLSKEDPAARVRAETGQWGADSAIEAVGSRAALESAFGAVRPGGTVSVVGVFTEPVTLPIQMFVLTGVTIRAGLGEVAQLPRLLRLVESREVDLKPIITHTLPLADAPRAYELLDGRSGGMVKLVLKV